MEWWQLLTSILGVIGVIYTGLHVYFKSKSNSKIESFRSIMEESKKFREEIREELNKAKNEISGLKNQIHQYELKIQELEEKLKDALCPRTWNYYYTQKPIKIAELENILKRHMSPTDSALILGDDSITQKSIDLISSLNSWTIHKPLNCTSAMDLLRSCIIKCIIIDLTMPVADLFELLNAVHENKKLSSIPLIIISSFGLKDVDRSLIHNKINEVLTSS